MELVASQAAHYHVETFICFKIWVSHSDEYVDCNLLECGTM
jgi:hypothetical protein